MPVTFDEARHLYTSTVGKNYISVTTLIKKYTPPFDSHYWSTYKAMKQVLEAKGEWATYKAKAGGWENVVAHIRHVDKTFPHASEVLVAKKQLLKMWADNRDESARKGTEFHKSKELADRTAGSVVHHKTKYPTVVLTMEELMKYAGDGVITEFLLYDDELEIAGQADWVLKSGNEICIKDYKTSKEISRVPFQDECLMHPVSHLPNANFYTYSLQLSLYGWMLERIGFRITELSLEHIDKVTGETLKIYPVEYLRNEIIELVNHHCATKKKELVT